MSAEFARGLAVSVTQHEYVIGKISAEDLEHRLNAIFGLAGSDEQERVLSTADGLIEVTSFGQPVPQFMPSRWHWPE